MKTSRRGWWVRLTRFWDLLLVGWEERWRRPPRRRHFGPVLLRLEPLEVRELLSAVQFSLSGYRIDRDAGAATITASLDAPCPLPVTVGYATANGSARAGTDYTATRGTLTFGPDVLSQAFQVPLLARPGGPDVTVHLALAEPGNATLGAQDKATLTILAGHGHGDRATVTALASSAPQALYSQPVTFTATVSPLQGHGHPSGVVTFADGNTVLGVGALDDADRASFTTMLLAGGDHAITAVYGGDDDFAASTSDALTQAVDADPASTTTVISSQNPTVYGQSVTFTATVSAQPPAMGTPTGTVTFKDGSTTLGTGTLNAFGQATYSASGLSVAAHSITAVYGGDSSFSGSTSSALTQTVNKASTGTALSSSLNPSTFGQSVTFTATVTATSPGTGTPGGTVTFKDGTTTLGSGTLNGSGQATYTVTTALAAGAHSITAVYGGSSSYNGSTSAAVTQTVNKSGSSTAVASSANPSVYGQAVTFTATVSAVSPGGGTPTGTVTFKDGSVTLGTGTLNGSAQATFTTSALAVAAHTVTAAYGGDGNFNASTSAGLSQAVNQSGSSSAVTSSLNPAVLGQSVTFTATVSAASPGSGTPTGSVTFKDGTSTLGTGTLNSSAQATLAVSSLAAGSHTITVVYGGDGNFSGSTSAALTQTVNNPVPSLSSLSPTAAAEGGNATLTVTGSSFVSGAVVQRNGVALATTYVSGTQLTAALGAADLADEGSLSITVVNPTPGGGASNALTFTVTDAALSATPATVHATEGAAFSGTVATFLDGDTQAPAGDFSVRIDWGDGTALDTSSGQVTGSNGSFTVTGTHTYAEEGSYTAHVTVSDDGGNTCAANSTASVADAALSGAVQAFSPVEGAAYSGVVAHVSDADPGGAAGDYTATITWGDGQSSAGTLTASGGGFDVSGAHTYAEEGPAAVTVQVNDAGGASVLLSGSTTVQDAPLTMTPLDFTASQNQAWSGTLATFSDAGGDPASYAAAIDWGDGLTSQSLLSGTALTGSHTYGQVGVFAVTVWLFDDGGSPAVATATATVQNTSLTAGGINLSATAGQHFSGAVATFSDQNAGMTTAYQAVIDWGDGLSTTGTVSGNSVLGDHTYAREGSYALAVTLSNDGGARVTATGTATVADAPLGLTAVPVQPAEGAAFTGVVAHFTDADPAAAPGSYTASITWGDGHASAGTVSVSPSGGFDVTGTNTYAEEGSYAVAVTVTDAGGATASVAGTAAVADAALAVTGVALGATEGAAVSGVVATFSDADPAAAVGDYTAAITWGDGQSSAGTVSADGHGGFTVSGTHTYADGGTDVVGITVTDAGGAVGTAATPVTVAEGALTASGTSASATEGAAFSGTVATFSDGNPAAVAGDFTATVSWGDGTTSAGTVAVRQGGGFQVSGTHAYAEEGTAAVSVTISEAQGGASATAAGTVAVADAALAATGAAVSAAVGAAFNGVVAHFSDADPGGVAGDYSVSIAWGDGQATPGVVAANTSGGFDVLGTHTYAQAGTDTVTVTVQDTAGGASATATGSAGVAAVAATQGQALADTVGAVAASFAGAAVTIAWGDGQSSAGALVANGAGGYDVTGTHTYAQPGPVTVSAQVTPPGGATTTLTQAVNVADPGLAAAVSAVSAVKEQAFSGVVATFTDADAGAHAGDFSAALTWGDGTTTAGTVTADPLGGFDVSGTHTYLAAGPELVGVLVKDAGGAVAVSAGTAQVADAPVSAALAPFSATAGQPFSGVVATFSAADPRAAADDFTATITWGDGSSSAGAVTADPHGGFDVSGSYAYAQGGSQAVSVAISHLQGGATATAAGTIAVAAAPLRASALVVTTTAGTSFSGVVATFRDDGRYAANNYAATVSWNGGAPMPGAVSPIAAGVYGVTATGTGFTQPGSQTATVTVTNTSSGASVTVVTTVSVLSGDLTPVPAGPLVETEGQAFSGPVLSFSDDSPTASVADFTQVLINWGDAGAYHGNGQPPPSALGTLTQAGGTFQVSGGYTYVEEGAYTVSVTLTDTAGQRTVLTTAAMVLGAPLTATAQTLTATEGQPVSGVVATFTDADPGAAAGDFSALIDWGDGNLAAGSITANAHGGFDVRGSNTYREEGSYPVTVYLRDEQGSGAVVHSTLAVSDVALAVSAWPAWGATAGLGFTRAVARFSEGAFDPTGNFTATISWGDGGSSSGVILGPQDQGSYYGWAGWGWYWPGYYGGGPSGNFVVSGSHSYAATGTYTVTVTVHDSDGSTASAGSTVTVYANCGVPTTAPAADPYLSVTAQNVSATEGQAYSGVVGTFSDSRAGDPGQAREYGVSIDWGDGTTGWYGWGWGWYGYGWGNGVPSRAAIARATSSLLAELHDR
jgi:hypothetical protein